MICFALSFLYLVPIFSMEDRWKIIIQNNGNFLIYLFLGIYLSNRKFHFSRPSLLIYLASLSIIIQFFQSFFDGKQFDMTTISLNFLGSLFGIYLLKIIVYLNKIIYQIINKNIKYKKNFEELIISSNEIGEQKSNFIKEILRNMHFYLNKHLREEDNIDIKLNTIYAGKLSYPVMSGNIFKHVFYGTPEADTLLILKENAQDSNTIFDLGAHYGFFSLFLSDLVGSNGKVLSFEPTESTFNLLKKNTLNKNNISIYKQGFFSSDVSITFNHYGDNYSGLNSIYSARLKEKLSPIQKVEDFIALDTFCEDQGLFPDLIKIDCESSEHEILKGSKRILQEIRPILVIEFGDVIDKDLPRSVSVYDLLLSNSYLAFRRYKEGYKKQVRQEYFEYFNCLFIPKERLEEFIHKNKIIED